MLVEKGFYEIKRILKPDGLFLNASYTRKFLDKFKLTQYRYKKYTLENLINITEKNKMKIIELKEIIKHESYCIISKNI